MDIQNSKKRPLNNNHFDGVGGTGTILRFFILSFGAVALLALFPSISNLSVFARGELAYLESIGIIFTFITLFSVFIFIFLKMFPTSRITSRFMKSIIVIGAMAVNIFCMMLVITFTWIRYDVKTNCEVAKKDYGGSCLEALANQLKDTNQGFRSRNSAIWTLGQLANKGSIPILKKYYTGKIPKKETLNKNISQYELRKALNWCEKGNITSWMYKGF